MIRLRLICRQSPSHYHSLGLIVIHQLPKTPRTLWCRLLGKGRVQEQAIREVAALPAEHPYRQNALDLLGNLTKQWKSLPSAKRGRDG